MTGQRKTMLKFAIVLALLAIALPVFADGFHGSLDGGNTNIVSVEVVNCTLNITISNLDAATFTVEVYDDYVLKLQTDVVQSGAGTFVVGYPISVPPGAEAPGIGIAVYKNGVPAALWDLVPYDISSCQTYVDAQCQSNAIIPHGAVVGALPAGGRAYWAPGKITPEVYIWPGHYWVVDAYVDENGQEWYELYISCAYLWVPAEWMTTTDDGPWNFEPLPLPSNLPPDVLEKFGLSQ